MSSINTNGINVNYPVPGTNNSSQGFRSNFASIKTNLDFAGDEITDLQNKVVVKAALANTTINNDMANTLISNASTRSFRETMYNLGNSLSGTVLVNASLGDVQYGNVSGNLTLQFGNWAPTGTKQTITLQLGFSNTSAFVNFPTNVVYSNNNFGLTLVENYNGNGAITVPYNVTQTVYELSTTDCGDTITITPVNRPYKSTQIIERSPSPKGFPNDVVGTICIDTGTTQLTVTNTYANDEILTSNTSSLWVDMPVVFTGTTFGGVTAGTQYYVANIPSATNFTIATSAGGANVNLTAASGNMYINPVQYLYAAVQDYNATTYSKNFTATTATTNVITLSNTTNIALNDPIIFSNSSGGLLANVVYYVKTIPSGTTITVSRSRTNGVADSVVTLTTTTGLSYTATAYSGADIWKRISLNSW